MKTQFWILCRDQTGDQLSLIYNALAIVCDDTSTYINNEAIYRIWWINKAIWRAIYHMPLVLIYQCNVAINKSTPFSPTNEECYFLIWLGRNYVFCMKMFWLDWFKIDRIQSCSLLFIKYLRARCPCWEREKIKTGNAWRWPIKCSWNWYRKTSHHLNAKNIRSWKRENFSAPALQCNENFPGS